MLVIHSRIAPQSACDAELELTFEARSKSRLRCFTTDSEEVGLFLERGQPALAALSGLVILHELLSLPQVLGIVAIVAASIGATVTIARRA